VAVLHCLKWNNNLISWNYTTEVQVQWTIIKIHTIRISSASMLVIHWNEIVTGFSWNYTTELYVLSTLRDPYHCHLDNVAHLLKWNNNLITLELQKRTELQYYWSTIKIHTIRIAYLLLIHWNKKNIWIGRNYITELPYWLLSYVLSKSVLLQSGWCCSSTGMK
jgi:hypothetical protein